MADKRLTKKRLDEIRRKYEGYRYAGTPTEYRVLGELLYDIDAADEELRIKDIHIRILHDEIRDRGDDQAKKREEIKSLRRLARTLVRRYVEGDEVDSVEWDDMKALGLVDDEGFTTDDEEDE